MDIYIENGGIIKTEWNEEFIIDRAFLIREGFLIKGLSEAIDEQTRRGSSGSAWDIYKS